MTASAKGTAVLLAACLCGCAPMRVPTRRMPDQTASLEVINSSGEEWLVGIEQTSGIEQFHTTLLPQAKVWCDLAGGSYTKTVGIIPQSPERFGDLTIGPFPDTLESGRPKKWQVKAE